MHLQRFLRSSAVLGLILSLATVWAPARADSAASGPMPTTSTTLVVSPIRLVYGQTAYLRAVVRPANKLNPPPTGTVTFLDGSTVIGTSSLIEENGSAIARVRHLFPIGRHPVSARYDGSATYVGSNSASITVWVARAGTHLRLTFTRTTQPGVYSINAAVKADSPGTGIPTGTVTFYPSPEVGPDREIALDASGRAHDRVSPPPGTYGVRVFYSADDNFRSTNLSITFTVP